MRELSPLNDVVADDLLLDRIASGAVDHPEPVAVLLGALAAHAAAPLQPVRTGRRSRRHRFLSGLAVLAVGASGAGMAAAVTQPNLGGGLPDDALSVRPPAVHRQLPPREHADASTLTEIPLSAIAYAASGPLSPTWGLTRMRAPHAASTTPAAGDPASATNLPRTGLTTSPPAAGSTPSGPGPAGTSAVSSDPTGAADGTAGEVTSPSGTVQPTDGTEPPAGATASSSSPTATDPAPGSAPDTGAQEPPPETSAQTPTPSQEPTTEPSNGAGGSTTQPNPTSAPGQVKTQQQRDGLLAPDLPVLNAPGSTGQSGEMVAPAAVGRGGVLPAQARPVRTQDASAVTTVTPVTQTG